MKHFDYLFILILSIVTIYIWYPITKFVLQWESYTYLIRYAYRPLYTSTWGSFASFDVQSMLTGSILSNLFGVNMEPYFWVEILSILAINISIYFLTKTLTNNSNTAFIAAFIFALYFFGLGFFLPNWYATFLQRVIINVPLLLISFLFLHRFLAGKKAKYYGLSLFLFFLSILLAHFGIYLTFPILLYPIFWKIFQLFSFRSLLKGLLISFPYVIIVVFFILIQKSWGESVGFKEYNILYFLAHPEKYHYIEGVVRQLVYMSQYPTVIQALTSKLYPLAFSDPISIYKFAYPILLTYIAGFLIVWVKRKKYRALLLTTVSSLIIILGFNIYFNRFDFLNDAGTNRYYYYPSIMLAIFWALLLTTISNKKTFFIIVGIVFVYFLANAALFRHYFSDVKRYTLPANKLYEYIVNNFNRFPHNSFIVVGPTPYFGPYETNFFTEQLGEKKNIVFRTEDISYGDWRPLASASAHLVTLTFNADCSCVKQETLR